MFESIQSTFLKGAMAALALSLTVPDRINSASMAHMDKSPQGLLFYIPGYRGNGNYASSANDAEKLGYATCQASVAQDGTPAEFAARALAEFDACRQQHLTIPRDKVLVICHSLGCRSAAYLAGERATAIGKIAFFGPAIYPDGTGKISAELENPYRLAKLIQWRQKPVICGGPERNETMESLCAFRKAGGEALVLRGGKDEHIPAQAAADYAAAMGVKVETISGLGHDAARNPKVIGRIWQWAQPR